MFPPIHPRSNAPLRLLAAVSLAGPCWLLPAASSHAADKPAIVRGKQLAQVCAACHGADGNSADPRLYPNLAAQLPAYLELQLVNFKSGERPNPLMKSFAATLNPADMRDLGQYFGAQRARPQASANHELELKGARIFKQGNAAGAPACASCHGADGAGQAPYPRVASQPAGYLLEQLHVYRDAPAFKNPLATVMKGVAAKLSENDMKAVAAYVATLP